MNAVEIKKFADEIIKAGETETVKIYVLEKSDKKPNSEITARIGGKPIGLTAENYPMFDGKAMQHLITLDLEAMPELKIGELEGKSAVALFVSDRAENNANDPDSGESKVILLTREDLKNGELEEIPNEDENASENEAATYTVEAVEVPTAIFASWEERVWDDEEPLGKLYEAVHNSAYAGGEPTFIQSESFDGQFVFQFDDKLIKTQLGDSGVMYVFADAAFWEGY